MKIFLHSHNFLLLQLIEIRRLGRGFFLQETQQTNLSTIKCLTMDGDDDKEVRGQNQSSRNTFTVNTVSNGR